MVLLAAAAVGVAAFATVGVVDDLQVPVDGQRPADAPPPDTDPPPVTGPDDDAGRRTGTSRDAAAPDEEAAEADGTADLARLGDLPILLPTADPVVVGFHEAATVTAIGVTPVGSLTEDRNTTRTELAEDVTGGTPYLVLTSRGRSAGPTSAIDVVMRPDEPVLAPVSGTVLDVRSYLLYGAHQDLRIEIVPDGRPDVRLVMIHVDGASVRIGDRVVAGVTPVATAARAFPFSSHIDRETEPDRFPHVHLELQPVDAARPGDEDDPEDGREADARDVQDDTGGGGSVEQATGG